MYKIVDISVETWNKASVITIHKNNKVNKTLLKLISISDIAKRWGGKNIYDLIDKEIKEKYMVKNLSDLKKLQIRNYKIDGAKFIKAAHTLCTFMKILQLQ